MHAGPGAPVESGGGLGRLSRLAQAASALLVLLLAYGLPILGTLAQGPDSVLPESPWELAEAALFTTVLVCTLVLSLQIGLLRAPLDALVGPPAPLFADLRRAGLLLLLLFGGAYSVQALVSAMTGGETPAVLLKLGQACREDPVMLLVMLGPVVWIQAALTEELTRAFLLRRAQALWPGQAGRLGGLLGMSAIFGLAHMYQGLGGMVGTFVIGLILGWAYQRWGRLRPLLLAHGVYDSLVLLALVYAPPGA